MVRLTQVFVRSVVAAVVIFGSLSLPHSVSAADDPQPGVQALLDSRLSALQARDRRAFLDTVDPQAPEPFRRAQAQLFDGLVTVPLRDMSLRVRLDDSGDLAPGLRLGEKYRADAYLPETRFSYRIGDYDDRPALDALWLTYVQRNDKWYVASDTDAEGIGLTTTRQLWDFGPVEVRSRDHVIVLARAGQSRRGAALADMAEEAMTIFAGRWSLPWSGRIPLIVPSSSAEILALLRTPVDIDKFSAFVSYSPVREAGWTTTPPRIYAQEANLAGQSRARQVGDLVHELTHAATAGLAGPFSPAWLQEGLAEYIRLDRPTEIHPPTGHRDSLPGAEQFAGSDTGSVSLAYSEATSAISYLGRTHGRDAPERVFSAVGARRITEGSPSYNLDAAIRETVGMSLAEFQAAWSADS